jgi:hypothetical protein
MFPNIFYSQFDKYFKVNLLDSRFEYSKSNKKSIERYQNRYSKLFTELLYIINVLVLE